VLFGILSAKLYFGGMKEETQGLDPQLLTELVQKKMPFGKYKDRILCDLPVSYLEWFAEKGFPPGKLGMLLSTMHVIKTNGLEYLLNPLKKLNK
jgi:uncharacterized protein (DUF3820 family)